MLHFDFGIFLFLSSFLLFLDDDSIDMLMSPY